MKQKFQLKHASEIAEDLLVQLAPHCTRIQIAGSIRRKKPQVGDIEILSIPKTQQTGLFDDVQSTCYEVCKIINSFEKIKGDPTARYAQRVHPSGICIDFFLVNELNWGYQLAIRTGSAEFSFRLACRWTQLGYHGHNGFLHKDGKVIPVREEIDLFNLLQLDWVEPEDRV